MKIVILDAFGVNPGDLSWDFLKKYGELTVYDRTKQDEVITRCQDATVVLTNRMHIGKDELEALPTLRYIGTLGTGYDMLDIPVCRQKGIVVCNIPGYSSDSVAQLAFSLLTIITTSLVEYDRLAKSGKWSGQAGFNYLSFPEFAGKTLGLIGYGAIGRRVAEIAKGYKMRVIASTPSKTVGGDGIATFMPLDDLLGHSDMISLHCPLNDTTRGMVNSAMIAKMKKGVYLVNTSRGAVLNESDVAAALNSGYLAGAGVDVLAVEPPLPENPLLTAKNSFITPHVAWTTMEARLRLLDAIEENLVSFLETGKGKTQLT